MLRLITFRMIDPDTSDPVQSPLSYQQLLQLSAWLNDSHEWVHIEVTGNALAYTEAQTSLKMIQAQVTETHKLSKSRLLLTRDQHHGGGGRVRVGEAPEALAQLVVSGVFGRGVDVGNSDLKSTGYIQNRFVNFIFIFFQNKLSQTLLANYLNQI